MDYRCFGLRLRSDIPLPDLAAADASDGDERTVQIRLGVAGTEVENRRQAGPTFEVGSDDYLLRVPGVARYRVRRGIEIVVEPAPGSAPADVRTFLLGMVLGALCHQRRMLPLHASAIVVAGRAIAFAGPSRAGKSTLAIHYADRGYRILSDDICALAFAEDGPPPLALPGAPKVKLWHDALGAMGRDPEALEAVRNGLKKYNLPLTGQAADEAVPLARIYVLREARLPRQDGITRCSGAAAFDDLHNNTYRRHLLAPMGCAEAHFGQCVALLRHVPVFIVGRRWGFDAFAETAARIERHFLDGEG